MQLNATRPTRLMIVSTLLTYNPQNMQQSRRSPISQISTTIETSLRYFNSKTQSITLRHKHLLTMSRANPVVFHTQEFMMDQCPRTWPQ